MSRSDDRALDLVTLGRAAVDLYGEQTGGRLEDMASFAKYLGGCPANIAVGAARLGLKVGILTRVGDDHMGRFVKETLAAEGVDVSQVKTDRDRLTALAILGIRDRETFPLIFYRENCADMALEAADINPAYVGRAKALVVTGTHFSTPKVDAASRTAIAAAHAAGTKVVLDIDYRPVLWGLAGRGDGETRYVSSAAVTAHLQSIAPQCDLIVGTDEEIHIAGGSKDTLAALRRLRELSKAVIVLKRGSEGATIFDGAIPDTFVNAIDCPGFPVEVFNVLGAGDGFMAGLLAGWLRGKDWKDAGRIANACGALVVARHACAPAMPSKVELEAFLARAGEIRVPRKDPELAYLHRVTTGRHLHSEVLALAFDHRRQFEELAQRTGSAPERIRTFKRLIGDAVAGMHRRIAIDRGDRRRPLRCGRARPFDRNRHLDRAAGGSARQPAIGLRGRSRTRHRASALGRPNTSPNASFSTMRPTPNRCAMRRKRRYCSYNEPPMPPATSGFSNSYPPAGRAPEAVVPLAMERLYEIGLVPDWWKLPPSADKPTWRRIGDIIRAHDSYSRGVLLLGLDASDSELAAAFTAAADEPMVRGFAVGRTIFWPVAEKWFAGTITDAEAIRLLTEACRRVVALWRKVRPLRAEDPYFAARNSAVSS